MNQIYDLHLWGGQDFDFYSGEGSHNTAITRPYLKAVITFLKSKQNNLTVCDLGCGDFNIGKDLVEYTQKYIAFDIVDSLIERNKHLYKADNLEFKCLDISKDKLPHGDCIILRQVLQHLSNAEIQEIVTQLHNYKYILITEHLPSGNFAPNVDIISGQGIRLKHKSGVDLCKAPFCLKIKKQENLSEITLDPKKGKIQTVLYTL
ncbi:MAG: class I SAM-dependent methyltransferase [Winogradskyella sp.]|nr:class I SAM-dependent methyltransferase [Winogradskyella sp.]